MRSVYAGILQRKMLPQAPPNIVNLQITQPYCGYHLALIEIQGPEGILNV